MSTDIEYNPVKRWWILFWYNDITRLLVVLIPSYFVVLIPLLLYLDLSGETIRNVLTVVYLCIFCWGVLDNDYTNLHRVGLDE